MAYEERLQSDGQIYTNNFKESDKQPDWTGKVTLTKEILKELVEKMRSVSTCYNLPHSFGFRHTQIIQIQS